MTTLKLLRLSCISELTEPVDWRLSRFFLLIHGEMSMVTIKTQRAGRRVTSASFQLRNMINIPVQRMRKKLEINCVNPWETNILILSVSLLILDMRSPDLF
jgi:hypothetical protein